MDSWQRRKVLLAKERKWADSYTPTPPALQGRDLKRGGHYFVLMHHDPKCWLLLAGWKCTCRPTTQFYAACLSSSAASM
jgi:hypothetical protein